MEVKIPYPAVERKKLQRQDVIRWGKWPFLLATVVCTVVNIATGPPAWCIIGAWSFWAVWSFLISPALIEYNRISLWIRFISSSSIMLVIIDTLFRSGWSILVVPIVLFGGLAMAGILFFTDLARQKQNMMPMLLLLATCLLSSISGLLLSRTTWEVIVMGAFAFALLVACFIVLGNDFIQEIKKRFHVR